MWRWGRTWAQSSSIFPKFNVLKCCPMSCCLLTLTSSGSNHFYSDVIMWLWGGKQTFSLSSTGTRTMLKWRCGDCGSMSAALHLHGAQLDVSGVGCRLSSGGHRRWYELKRCSSVLNESDHISSITLTDAAAVFSQMWVVSAGGVGGAEGGTYYPTFLTTFREMTTKWVGGNSGCEVFIHPQSYWLSSRLSGSFGIRGASGCRRVQETDLQGNPEISHQNLPVHQQRREHAVSPAASLNWTSLF